MMYHVFLQVSENDKLKASARDNSASSPRKKAKTREGREGKGREGKGREGKGREGKGREGTGREGKGICNLQAMCKNLKARHAKCKKANKDA